MQYVHVYDCIEIYIILLPFLLLEYFIWIVISTIITLLCNVQGNTKA